MVVDMEFASRRHDWQCRVRSDGHVQEAEYPNNVAQFEMLVGIKGSTSGWAAPVETDPAELLCSHGVYLRIGSRYRLFTASVTRKRRK